MNSNTLVSMICIIISQMIYFFWGYNPGAIYFLVMALIFGYWSVDKTINVKL